MQATMTVTDASNNQVYSWFQTCVHAAVQSGIYNLHLQSRWEQRAGRSAVCGQPSVETAAEPAREKRNRLSSDIRR